VTLERVPDSFLLKGRTTYWKDKHTWNSLKEVHNIAWKGHFEWLSNTFLDMFSSDLKRTKNQKMLKSQKNVFLIVLGFFSPVK